MKKLLFFSMFLSIFSFAEELSTDTQKMMQERQRLYGTQDSANQVKKQEKKEYKYQYQYKKGDGSNSGSGNIYKGSKGNGGGRH